MRDHHSIELDREEYGQTHHSDDDWNRHRKKVSEHNETPHELYEGIDDLERHRRKLIECRSTFFNLVDGVARVMLHMPFQWQGHRAFEQVLPVVRTGLKRIQGFPNARRTVKSPEDHLGHKHPHQQLDECGHAVDGDSLSLDLIHDLRPQQRQEKEHDRDRNDEEAPVQGHTLAVAR